MEWKKCKLRYTSATCAALLWSAFIWAVSWLAAVFGAIHIAQPECLCETSSAAQLMLQQPGVLCFLSCSVWAVHVLCCTEALGQRLRWNKGSGSHLPYLLRWFKWSHVGVNVVWQGMGSVFGSLGCVEPSGLRAVAERSVLLLRHCLFGVEFGRYSSWGFAWLLLQVKREWKLFFGQVSSVFFPSCASGGCIGELEWPFFI